jgi:general secretion pathway protein E
MVGEIRDKETADNAVQAALTGHLVFSTLHTNDAPSSVTRLLDLGIPHFLVNSTVLGIIAQRLVRKICAHCKKERELTREEVENLRLKEGTYRVSYGEGCTECRGTGYKGRTAVFEIMEFTDKIKSVVARSTDAMLIAKTARSEGLSTLRESAVMKMLQGVTTYEEVVSVT